MWCRRFWGIIARNEFQEFCGILGQFFWRNSGCAMTLSYYLHMGRGRGGDQIFLDIYDARYRVFSKHCVFSLKFCDFPELCQFCCSAGVLPAWCVYTNWHRGKTEKGQSPEYFKIFGKKQYLMNTLYQIRWPANSSGLYSSVAVFFGKARILIDLCLQ